MCSVHVVQCMSFRISACSAILLILARSESKTKAR